MYPESRQNGNPPVVFQFNPTFQFERATWTIYIFASFLDKHSIS
ncbi:hypothetical protein LEP1GSC125_3676 [Leptospira mayottensis 200901122]|uniref:Uncharacterized protein n=1 Tax=Leptospira mayottensis 200901122 TaxID=1193010 RepID=A0AA87MLF1_9LEPT|nr:hypothetical protein LEP1GSC125_3676 [Leptospira mayottensis 200901122]